MGDEKTVNSVPGQVAMEADAKSKSKRKGKGMMQDLRCHEGAEGLNFNPGVNKFTDICTSNGRTTPHSFSGKQKNKNLLSFQFQNVFGYI